MNISSSIFNSSFSRRTPPFVTSSPRAAPSCHFFVLSAVRHSWKELLFRLEISILQKKCTRIFCSFRGDLQSRVNNSSIALTFAFEKVRLTTSKNYRSRHDSRREREFSLSVSPLVECKSNPGHRYKEPRIRIRVQREAVERIVVKFPTRTRYVTRTWLPGYFPDSEFPVCSFVSSLFNFRLFADGNHEF